MVHVTTPSPTEASRDEIILLAGPRLIGLLFNWGLLGVLTAQVYIYHVNFPKDKRLLKVIVYVVYLLDWAQTSSATYDAFQWFVYNWGNIPDLFLRYTGFLNVPLLSSIIGAIVQIFYGWRIWTFSQARLVVGLVCLLTLLQLGAGIVVSVYMFNDATELAKNPHLVRAVGVRLAGSAMVDTVISVSMTYFLLRSRAQALGPMNNFMTRLIRLTVETGTITVIAAIADLVFYLKEHNGLHQVSAVILCKLYSNTLLVLFNNRLVDRGRIEAASSEAGMAFRVGHGTAQSTTFGEVTDFNLETVKADREYTHSMEHAQ